MPIHMLAAVQALYSTATVAVRVQGQRGPALQSQTGVKQGCPVSPTLFGLLADGLHRSLQHAAAASGVQLTPALSVTDLGYADDFALLSATAEGLQALISVAAAWCAAVGMQPSPDKTVVMELTRAAQPQHSWQCGGAQLRCVSEARYLGMLFRSGHSFQPTFSHLEQRMWASHYFLRPQGAAHARASSARWRPGGAVLCGWTPPSCCIRTVHRQRRQSQAVVRPAVSCMRDLRAPVPRLQRAGQLAALACFMAAPHAAGCAPLPRACAHRHSCTRCCQRGSASCQSQAKAGSRQAACCVRSVSDTAHAHAHQRACWPSCWRRPSCPHVCCAGRG